MCSKIRLKSLYLYLYLCCCFSPFLYFGKTSKNTAIFFFQSDAKKVAFTSKISRTNNKRDNNAFLWMTPIDLEAGVKGQSKHLQKIYRS